MEQKIVLDNVLWNAMTKALSEVAAPVFTHNAIQQILQSVYREAMSQQSLLLSERASKEAKKDETVMR